MRLHCSQVIEDHESLWAEEKKVWSGLQEEEDNAQEDEKS